MKTLIILLTALMMAFPTCAQDGYNQSHEHYQVIKSITQNLTKSEACDLADLLISNAGYDYSFWRISETSSSLTYVFTLKKPLMNRNEVSLLTIAFAKTNTGFDFTAMKVYSESSDAIYIWQRLFLPSATWDLIRANYKYRDLISPDGGVKIRLLNGDEIKSFKKEKQTKY